MLTDAERDIVRATIPVLKEHGEAITSEFYQQLFIGHPKLLDIFNLANQRKGDQSASLATSILMYAAHIDRIDKLGDMVDYIAHKHGSLEVQPEHYPIVGDYLLRAIRTVLGEAATDEITDAWGAAYGNLAELFIKGEQQLYQQTSTQAGGWKGYKNFIVTARTKEGDNVMSLYLVPEDCKHLPPFSEG
jgi:nitric oxide dioxygenase